MRTTRDWCVKRVLRGLLGAKLGSVPCPRSVPYPRSSWACLPSRFARLASMAPVLAVLLRSLGKHGTRQWRFYPAVSISVMLLVGLAMAARAAPAADAASDGTAAESNPATVRIAGIVLKWIRTNKEANFRRAQPMIRKAAAEGARVVCTTECFLDGYAIADKSIPLDTYRDLGEPIPGGKYYRQLAALADELEIHLVAGMMEAAGKDRYNTAVLIGPDGRLLGKYHKQKLGHEHVRNTPGDASPLFETPYGRVGLIICADRTEKTIVRRFCAAGADFLICPSGGMFGPERNDPIVQSRSRENKIHIIFVHPAEFLVTGPDGSILKRTILGDRLLISPEQVGGQQDQNRVFYFDLPLQ